MARVAFAVYSLSINTEHSVFHKEQRKAWQLSAVLGVNEERNSKRFLKNVWNKHEMLQKHSQPPQERNVLSPSKYYQPLMNCTEQQEEGDILINPWLRLFHLFN